MSKLSIIFTFNIFLKFEDLATIFSCEENTINLAFDELDIPMRNEILILAVSYFMLNKISLPTECNHVHPFQLLSCVRPV